MNIQKISWSRALRLVEDMPGGVDDSEDVHHVEAVLAELEDLLGAGTGSEDSPPLDSMIEELAPDRPALAEQLAPLLHMTARITYGHLPDKARREANAILRSVKPDLRDMLSVFADKSSKKPR